LFVLWGSGDNPPNVLGFLATDTPTATATATPLPPSATATITDTPEPTETPTPSGPITYFIKQDDTLGAIAEEFGVDLLVLMSYNNLTDANQITVGMELTIPPPDTEYPTETALPETLIPGSLIQYIVKSGDSLVSIAAQFNSTAEAIAEENGIEDLNNIFIGQSLSVPVDIATPTATSAAATGS